ncbi:MAG: RNA polymerase sigma-70 factor [Tannerellaceae bacterium]|nr:RNA polymerase sigma-70 factor [Tannerellaceae bacterium]
MTFDEFYIHWYSRMKWFACEYVISEDDAEDIVQEVFADLYEKYALLTNHVNLVAYIYTTIKNRCIDHIRHKLVEKESADKIRQEYLLTLQMKFDSLEILENDLFKDKSVETVIEEALNTLPERCREIFIMHKIEGKKQKIIAAELKISPKTVENQISVAYQKLRKELRNYMPLVILLLQ